MNHVAGRGPWCCGKCNLCARRPGIHAVRVAVCIASVGGGQSFAKFFSKFGGARKRKKFREIWALLHEICSITSVILTDSQNCELVRHDMTLRHSTVDTSWQLPARAHAHTHRRQRERGRRARCAGRRPHTHTHDACTCTQPLGRMGGRMHAQASRAAQQPGPVRGQRQRAACMSARTARGEN